MTGATPPCTAQCVCLSCFTHSYPAYNSANHNRQPWPATCYGAAYQVILTYIFITAGGIIIGSTGKELFIYDVNNISEGGGQLSVTPGPKKLKYQYQNVYKS